MHMQVLANDDDIINFVSKLLKNHTLPSFLFSSDIYKRLVVGMSDGDNPIGLAYGVIKHETSTFFLHFFYIAKMHRTNINVRELLTSTFVAATSSAGVDSAVWKFTSADESVQSHLQMMASIPFCRVNDVQSVRMIGVKANQITHLRKFKIFNTHLWQDRGYAVLTLSESSQDLKTKVIRSVINVLQDDGVLIDERNLFVFAKADSNEPVGWMLCSESNANDIVIRYFYMCETERSKMIAHSFAAYILDSIAASREYLWFQVTKGNRQMEMIVKKYFAPIADVNRVTYSLIIDITGAQDVNGGDLNVGMVKV